MLPVVWGVLGVATVAAAIRSRTSTYAMKAGRMIVGTLYLAAGALVNLVFLARGDDYAEFAEGSYIPFVRDTWQSLVVPNVAIFISLLIVFEAAVGVSVLKGGTWTQAGLAAAIAFHIALLTFGFGFYIWSVPMIAALVTLLRAERRQGSRQHARASQGLSRAA